MATGQVSFHSSKLVKRTLIPSRTNEVINRLSKTRTEIPPPESSSHLREERDAHLAAKRKKTNEVLQKKKKEEQKLAKERRENKVKGEREWEELYGEGRVEEEGKGNWEGFDEDDFM